MNVVVETDVGHDSDDLVALLSALKDHKTGKISLRYIATVSQNNKNRAKLVKWICDLFGVSDVPIIASGREKAKEDDKDLNNSVALWNYEYDSTQDEYVYKETSEPVVHLYRDSIEARRTILKQHKDVHVLVIGPGIEAEAFEGTENNIKRVVWQGYPNDSTSFNIGSDPEAFQRMYDWCKAKNIPQLFIGKGTAYKTRLTKKQFTFLSQKASEKKVDLQMLLQLGVMEFRDAARNLFNIINFDVSTFEKREELGEILTQKSTKREWFNKLEQLTPMYDLTAYLLLRDVREENGAYSHPYYNIYQEEDVWTVGESARDDGIKLQKDEYMKKVVEELTEACAALLPMEDNGAETVPAG